MATTVPARSFLGSLLGYALLLAVVWRAASRPKAGVPSIERIPSTEAARAVGRTQLDGSQTAVHDDAGRATGWWSLLKETFSSWSDHKAARLGAALAYYSVFSIGPLMLIAIAIAGLIFGQDAVRGEVSAQLKGLLGNAGAEAIEGMLAGARRPMEGLWSALSRCSWLQPAW